MKVFQVEGQWTHDNLLLSSRPDPQPGPGEVRVAMRAAAETASSSSRQLTSKRLRRLSWDSHMRAPAVVAAVAAHSFSAAAARRVRSFSSTT